MYFQALREFGTQKNQSERIDYMLSSNYKSSNRNVTGASGSGKTTLLNTISTIDSVTSGNIIINGVDITNLKEEELSNFRKKNLGFVFQDFNLLDTLTIKENLTLFFKLINLFLYYYHI